MGHKVDYEDSTSFRRLFKRRTSLTPAAYRRKFASIVKVAKNGAAAATREAPSVAQPKIQRTATPAPSTASQPSI